MKPSRFPLAAFPDVVIHAEETQVKRHPEYLAAKSGDIDAADRLVAALINPQAVSQLRELCRGQLPLLVPVHALETMGVNEIPAALARALSNALSLTIWDEVAQINTVGHTGASGFHRLAHQALFSGVVIGYKTYLLVDDFIGQGGTLANLHGYIRAQGGAVCAATVLTGKPYSAILSPDPDSLRKLRAKHGQTLEDWWHTKFGHGYDALTRSEARYLENSPDAQTIRDRIAAAGFEGGDSSPA